MAVGIDAFPQQMKTLFVLSLATAKWVGEFVVDLHKECLLCPVRAVRFYLDATFSLTQRPYSLFVSPLCPLRVLAKNVLSYFHRQVIYDAGAVWDVSAGSPRAHGVQGVATFLQSWSVSKVLEVATWRANPVFTLHYFKNLSFQLDNCNSLGPFVAVGSVLL